MKKAMHYADDNGLPICKVGGCKTEVTYQPRRVTCGRCRMRPEWLEMMEGDPL